MHEEITFLAIANNFALHLQPPLPEWSKVCFIIVKPQRRRTACLLQDNSVQSRGCVRQLEEHCSELDDFVYGLADTAQLLTE